MGYITAMGECYVCKKLFSFNPTSVPSIKSPESGEKEPICEDCIAIINTKRSEIGIALWPVSDDAYTYCKEEELEGGDE